MILSMGIKHHALNPMMQLPNNDPRVPILVKPPESPCSIGLNEIIDIGLYFDIFPNSVAQVSDIEAATEARKR